MSSVDRNQLPVLSRQLESLSHRADVFQSREQEERDWFGAVLASLRLTHGMISNGVDPRMAAHEFVVDVAESGTVTLKQAGLPVPVDEDYLLHVFLTMGVPLAPGQVLILEPRMAKWAIEESLWGLELDRAMSTSRPLTDVPSTASLTAWSRKRDLVMASRIADELLDRGAVRPPRAV